MQSRKCSRSTASAAPAGTRIASAARMTSDPSRRISSLKARRRCRACRRGKNCCRRVRRGCRSCARPWPHGPHLMERDRHAERRRLPRRFAAGESAADDDDVHQLARLATGGLAVWASSRAAPAFLARGAAARLFAPAVRHSASRRGGGARSCHAGSAAWLARRRADGAPRAGRVHPRARSSPDRTPRGIDAFVSPSVTYGP